MTITSLFQFHSQTWSKLELVELIIATGTELRNEANLDIVALRDYCDDVSKQTPIHRSFLIEAISS